MANTNKLYKMNDYWNDPPDYPEPSECCDDIMDVLENGACLCPTCGKRIEPQMEPDPSWEVNDNIDFSDMPIEDNKPCPHGDPSGTCDHCDYLSDLAYDSAREARTR